MNFDTAKRCIDWISDNVPDDTRGGIELSFIGGEPLIEFDIIKETYTYAREKITNQPLIFYATTNGTLLSREMKSWFFDHRKDFILGLSLDGTPETHNHNRSNSFELIDIDFFARTWPRQGIKMTLSDYSLRNLADNIIYLHSLGFEEIDGVNLFEGNFDWSDEENIRVLIPQLEKLVKYYSEHDDMPVNQMLSRQIAICEEKDHPRRKWCGIGTGTIFFDTDGTRLPCPFTTPMTFGPADLSKICKTDFNDEDNFIDEFCFEKCYIYPICPHCPAANYLGQGSFKTRDKSRCRIQILITLFAADLAARRIVNSPERYSNQELLSTINAVEKIRNYYLPEFSDYVDSL